MARDEFEDEDLESEDEDANINEVFADRPGELDGPVDLSGNKDPLDLLEEKQDELDKGNRWQTGLCLLQIYRDLPINDSKGNKISGKIRDINHRIESDWFEKNVGGGTYHVKLRGPSLKHPHHQGKPILGAVHNIVIAGKPFINNQVLDDSDLSSGSQPAGRDEIVNMLADNSRRMERMLSEQNKETKEKLERIEKMREQERQHDETHRKEREMGLFESIEAAREKERQAAREEQQRSESLFATILKSSNDPEREAGIRRQIETMQEAMRQSSENHMRELRDLGESHRQQLDQTRRDYQEQMQQLRNEWTERERTIVSAQSERERLVRDEYDRRERDLRDATMAREQSLRDEMDRRERGMKDSADKEEKHLLQQVLELKDELRAARDKVENLGKEASEAKFERIKAEMMVAHAQDNPGGLMGLAKNMEEFQAVASMLGLAKGEADASMIDQVTAVLNTEAAKRVGTGLANLAGGLVARGQQAPQLQAPQVLAPAPDALAQWNAIQAQMRQQEAFQQAQGGVQRTAVRHRAPVTPEAVAEAARAAQTLAEQQGAPMVESTLPQEVLDQALPGVEMVDVPPEQYADEAKQLMALIDQALDADKTGEELWEAVAPMFGEQAAMVVAVHPDVIIKRLEEGMGTRLSIRARKLVKEALAFGKSKQEAVDKG